VAHYLITGHTGFKGAWLISLLKARGHEVSGIALDPLEGSLFSRAGMADDLEHDYRVDIRDYEKTVSAFRQIQPDHVIHMAAQALVREGYRNPVYTYETNVNGTFNILRSVDETDSVRSHLVVTTDKVYLNQGLGRPYLEGDPLGGKDPYSASKAMADILAQEWLSRADAKPGAIARAGNVIGAGDHSADRLIPDILRAVSSGKSIKVRFPYASRPWQHVLDCLDGYLSLLDHLTKVGRGGGWNFGPINGSSLSVLEVVELASTLGLDFHYEIQEFTLHWQEEEYLALDSTKASEKLGWGTRLTQERAIEWALASSPRTDDELLALIVREQISSFHSIGL